MIKEATTNRIFSLHICGIKTAICGHYIKCAALVAMHHVWIIHTHNKCVHNINGLYMEYCIYKWLFCNWSKYKVLSLESWYNDMTIWNMNNMIYWYIGTPILNCFEINWIWYSIYFDKKVLSWYLLFVRYLLIFIKTFF